MLLQRVIKNVMAVCLGLLLSLLMIGGFILIFSKSGIILNQNYKGNAFSYMKDDLLGYILLPNQKVIRYDADGEFTVSINSLGFRNSESEPLYNYSKYINIMILGDSFTFGGVSRSPFPQILSHKLIDISKSNILVSNFGTPGYGTINEYAILEKYGHRIKPHVVIVAFFIGNDFSDNLIPLNQIRVINGYLVYNVITWSNNSIVLTDRDLNNYVNLATDKGLSPYSLAQLIRIDKFGDQMTFVEKTARQLGINFPDVRTVVDFIKAKLSMSSILSFGITTSAYYRVTEEEERVTKEYLIKINRKCRQLDAELILVMIPEHIGNYDNSDKRKTLKRISAETGITKTIDLFPLFKDGLDKYYLEYDAHFSQRGHQAVADILLDYMLSHNLITRREPADN